MTCGVSYFGARYAVTLCGVRVVDGLLSKCVDEPWLEVVCLMAGEVSNGGPKLSVLP
jgi:hypothetical protein